MTGMPQMGPEVRDALLRFVTQVVRPEAQIDRHMVADLALHAANEAMLTVDRVTSTLRPNERALALVAAMLALRVQGEQAQSAFEQLLKDIHS